MLNLKRLLSFNFCVLTLSGYTPQSMLPLYVRNTLVEPNGSTPGGDQVQDVMALDRRYSHYIGRPLNRFEPDKSIPATDLKTFISPYKRSGVNIGHSKGNGSSSEIINGMHGNGDLTFETGSVISSSDSFASALSKTHRMQLQYRLNNIAVKDNAPMVLPPIPNQENSSLQSSSASSNALDEKAAKKNKRDQRKRVQTMGAVGLTHSLVRMAFGKHNRPINDYLYEEEEF